MKTRIISAFPGTGKTFYHRNNPNTTLDSDSSNFSWIVREGEKRRNPEFPKNYIEHIKNNIGKYEFIFVSSHKEVRDILLENNIFFYLAYPDKNRKNEFIKRFRGRGSDENFVKLISDNWENWIKECDYCNAGCFKIKMFEPDNLENKLLDILKTEGESIETTEKPLNPPYTKPLREALMKG